MEEARFTTLRIVSAERVGYYFGKKCDDHLVMFLRGKETGDDSKLYEETLLILPQEGKEWDFSYGKTSVVTEEDQKKQVEHINEIFPEYGKFALDGDAIRGFISWINSGNVTVNAKIDPEPYVDKNGDAHLRFKTCKPGKSFDSNWIDKLGASVAKAVNENAKKVAKSEPAYENTKAGAWTCYQKMFKATDPTGDNFWDEVSKITGKDAADWKEFHAEDWQKCIDAFAAPF